MYNDPCSVAAACRSDYGLQALFHHPAPYQQASSINAEKLNGSSREGLMHQTCPSSYWQTGYHAMESSNEVSSIRDSSQIQRPHCALLQQLWVLVQSRGSMHMRGMCLSSRGLPDCSQCTGGFGSMSTSEVPSNVLWNLIV